MSERTTMSCKRAADNREVGGGGGDGRERDEKIDVRIGQVFVWAFLQVGMWSFFNRRLVFNFYLVPPRIKGWNMNCTPCIWCACCGKRWMSRRNLFCMIHHHQLQLVSCNVSKTTSSEHQHLCCITVKQQFIILVFLIASSVSKLNPEKRRKKNGK